MRILVQDIRTGARQLWRRPLFTTTAVLTLAVGMGINTVAFSVVNSVLFKGSAIAARPNAGRILTTPGGDESGNASLEEYRRFLEATKGSLDLAAEGRASVGWRHAGITQTAWALYISPNYFSIVDPDVLLGHVRVERVPGEAPAVVIGERFWREKLGAPPLTGLTLQLSAVEVGVAGVMRESFTGPAGLYSPDVWLPLDHLALFGPSPVMQRRDTRWLFLLGDLQRDATVPQVQSQIDAAAATLAREWPDTHAGRGARFKLFSERNSELRGLSTAATIAMGIIGLILLLACFNVANLLLARAVERQRDMGIRAALGAHPSRLVRLVVTEGLLLATLSGLMALVVAWWAQALVGTFAIPIDEPQHVDLSPDGRVVGFVVVLVCIAGVLPGLWPALAAARVNVSRVLTAQSANSAGGRPSVLGRWLIGAQIAGSTAFLALAALFIQSYFHLLSVDLGFARDHLVLAEFEPAAHGHAGQDAERYAAALQDRVLSVPGVEAIAIADRAPFFIGFDRETAVWPAGGRCDSDSCPKTAFYVIGPGYFRALGIPMMAGREFAALHTSGEVVINEAFARRQWPNGGGLGETIRVGISGTALTVVGIAGRTHMRGVDRERPHIFLPLTTGDFDKELTLVARTAIAPSLLLRAVTEAAREIDPHMPLLSAKSMEQRTAVQLWPFRTLSLMFTICGLLALLLAVIGLAGVVIHAVSRRMREFGVRMSCGATPRDLMSDVLRDGWKLLMPGLAAGILITIAAAHMAQAAFVGVNVLNPLTYAIVVLVQCVIVALACIGPARRAARVDPLVALRSE